MTGSGQLLNQQATICLSPGSAPSAQVPRCFLGLCPLRRCHRKASLPAPRRPQACSPAARPRSVPRGRPLTCLAWTFPVRRRIRRQPSGSQSPQNLRISAGPSSSHTLLPGRFWKVFLGRLEGPLFPATNPGRAESQGCGAGSSLQGFAVLSACPPQGDGWMDGWMGPPTGRQRRGSSKGSDPQQLGATPGLNARCASTNCRCVGAREFGSCHIWAQPPLHGILMCVGAGRRLSREPAPGPPFSCSAPPAPPASPHPACSTRFPSDTARGRGLRNQQARSQDDRGAPSTRHKAISDPRRPVHGIKSIPRPVRIVPPLFK